MKHIYSNHALTLTGNIQCLREPVVNLFLHNFCIVPDVDDIESSLGPFSGYINLEIFDLFREFAGKFGLSKFAGGLYEQR